MRLFLLVVSVLLCGTRAYTDHIEDQIAQIVQLLNNLSATIINTCTCPSTPLNDIQGQRNNNKALQNGLVQNKQLAEGFDSSDSTVSGYPSQLPADQDTDNWVNSIISEADNSVPETTTSKSNKFNIKRLPIKEHSSCTTTEGEEGKCVKPRNCTLQPQQTDDRPPFVYRESSCASLLRCCPLDKIKKAPKKSNTLLNKCGWTKPVQNNLDHAEEFPWTVSIVANRTDEDLISIGALIHPSVALSGGRILTLFVPDEVYCHAERSTSNGDVHYDRNVLKIEEVPNDIIDGYVALVFLEAPFILSETPAVGVACLTRTALPGGTSCTAIDRDDRGRPACRFTVQTPSKSLDHKECQKTRTYGRCFGFVLMGSPVMCPLQTDDSGTRYVVSGIIHDYKDCALSPQEFHELPLMIDWIDRQMAAAGLDKTAYTV